MINNENDNYEIIDIKNQAKYKVWQETSDRKRYSSDLRDFYRDVDISNFEEKNYKNDFQKKIFHEIKDSKKNDLFKIGNMLKKFFVGIVIINIVFIALLILFTIVFPDGHYSSDGDYTPFQHFFGTVMCIAALVFVIVGAFGGNFIIYKVTEFFTPKVSDALYKSFTKPTLADLKKTFFNSLKIEYYPIVEVLSQVDNISELMAKINPAYKKFVRADDFISFSYKNLPISIVEFRSVGLEASSCIFIATKINKNITSETFVKTKDCPLDNLSFSENFSVQSFNPQEARSLLTSAFRARLLKYRKEHNNCQIDILFSNKVSDKENIFICIPSQKNYFEMSEQDWKDESKSYQIISEIREILLILETLKLDQDIGL